MAYPIIEEHRIPYDIDGTEVAYKTASVETINNAIEGWLTETQKSNLQKNRNPSSFFPGNFVYFFFPSLMEISKVYIDARASGALNGLPVIHGSTDSANGVDGTWVPAIYTFPPLDTADTAWRKDIFAVSFPSPIKVLRIYQLAAGGYNYDIFYSAVHLYGRKAAGEIPDDIAFCTAAGVELTELTDWGDVPEGTTDITSYAMKNTSASKIANMVNLQLNHPNYTMSWSADGPWQSVLDIASIGPGSLSAPFYVRNLIQPPLQILGPFNGRIIASVGSWT